jgi:class 3 adenylate cyclase
MAARVASKAAGGDVVVSRTVKDLVAGSGIEFEEFGSYVLKGIPEEHQLCIDSDSVVQSPGLRRRLSG